MAAPTIIQVVRTTTVSAPRMPDQTFPGGAQVNPGSAYYWQLLWSGNATDTGLPWPNVVPDAPYEPVLVQKPTSDAQIPEWDQPTNKWQTIPTPAGGGGGGGGAVTKVAGRTGDVVLNQDDVADSATYVRLLGTERSKLAAIAPGATANAADAALRDRSTHTGTQSADTITDGTANKAYTAAEKTKLGSAEVLANKSTATALGASDIFYPTQAAVKSYVDTGDTAAKARANHTGTQSADTLVDGTTNKAFLATERTKLAGIAAAATANSTDAQLNDRANHTGTQTSITISDFQEAVEDAVAAILGRSTQTGITWTYNDASNTLSASVAGGGGTYDDEAARDALGAALVGVGNISVVANDALDTITISTTATVNSTDAALRDRSTHTGTQSLDTTTDSGTRVAMTPAERTKLGGVATGATANSADATLLARANHTGTQNADTIVASATKDVMLLTERTKLGGIATAATANSPDATLLARANHTGTQSLDTTVDSAVSTGRLAMTTAERTKLAGIATAATANATDASLRDRTTHTGAQPTSTITGLDTALLGKRALKNQAVTNLTAGTETLEKFNVISDGTATAGWPNRAEYGCTPVGGGSGGAARVVFYMNEYFEHRLNARQNTVLWRAFVREFSADPAHDMATPIWEIQNDRDNRVQLHGMFGQGNFYHAGDGTVAGSLAVSGTVMGSNIGVPIKGVYNAGSEPAGQPAGTIILVR